MELIMVSAPVMHTAHTDLDKLYCSILPGDITACNMLQLSSSCNGFRHLPYMHPSLYPLFNLSIPSIFSFSMWCTLLGCGCLISTPSALHGPWFPSGSTARTRTLVCVFLLVHYVCQNVCMLYGLMSEPLSSDEDDNAPSPWPHISVNSHNDKVFIGHRAETRGVLYSFKYLTTYL